MAGAIMNRSIAVISPTAYIFNLCCALGAIHHKVLADDDYRESMTIRLHHFFRSFAALLLCVVLAGCSDAEDVYTGLTLKDANEMVAVLRQKGIEAQRGVDGAGANAAFKVTVPKDKFSDSVLLLSQNGYPRETFKSLAEVFPGEGLVVSPMEQRARYAYAISQELSRTISGIDGVVKARVHVVMADPEARVGQPSKASASISVHLRPNIDSSDLAPKIRLIVSNAVQGLSYNDVSLSFFTMGGLDTPAAPAMPGMAEGQGGMAQTPAPQMAEPQATPGEVAPRRIVADEPKVEAVTAEASDSSWSWSGMIQYIAAFLAVVGGILYIRRVMRGARED